MNKLKWSGVNLLFSFIYMILCFAVESPTEITEKYTLSKYAILFGIDFFILYMIWFLFILFNKKNVSFVLSDSYKKINYIFGGFSFLIIIIKLIFFNYTLFTARDTYHCLLDINIIFILLSNMVYTTILLHNIRNENKIYQQRNTSFYQTTGICLFLSFSYMMNIFTMKSMSELLNHKVEYMFSDIFSAVNCFIIFLILIIFNVLIKRTSSFYTHQKAIKIFNYNLLGIESFFISFNIIVNFYVLIIAEYRGHALLGFLNLFILAWMLVFTIINFYKSTKRQSISNSSSSFI